MTSEVDYKNIPRELKERRQWVCYRIEKRKGKPIKMPYRADGRTPAKSNDLATWHTFEEVLEAAGKPQNRFDGIGYVLSEADPYVFIDLDHVINDGVTEDWAQDIVEKADSYAEFSRSGTGIHIIVRAKKPGDRCRTLKHPKFEIYENVRLAVFTGKLYPGSPAEIRDAQALVEEVYFEVFGHDPPVAAPAETSRTSFTPDLSDSELIERAMSAANGDKFSRLWSGNIGDYGGDDSSADMALCRMLAFWTNRDAVRIVKLFRQSGLMRDKWDERRGNRTYGEMTIEKAIQQTPETYQGDSWKSAVPVSHEVTERAVVPWPDPPRPEVYHGLAGEIVRAIEPHSEADPMALLSSLFAAFGNAVGRSAHFPVEADRHYASLFIVQVGVSSKGRKGTSLNQILSILRDACPDWSKQVKSGLSSGEGLIWAVRDPIEKLSPVRDKGKVVEYQSVIEDEGIADKRLLVTEGELASTLRVLGREGNNLSAIIRNAWDTGDLTSLTKNSPARATGAHISIIGHITKDELLRYLDSTESGNGFANRFIWVCVKRSKILPEGGHISEEQLRSLVDRLCSALSAAREIGIMARDAEARELWFKVYPRLSEGRPGLLGSVIGRAEAQVMRLACIYALFDLSAVIRVEHLRAALAFWDYAEESARFIFGDSLGDPMADELLRALRDSPDGLTRTEIIAHFGRHKSAETIGRALRTLAERGLVKPEKEPSAEGRPTERWIAVRPDTPAVPCETSEQSETMPASGSDTSHCSPISQSGTIPPSETADHNQTPTNTQTDIPPWSEDNIEEF